MTTPDLIQVSEYVWELPAVGGMRVPGRVYADRELIQEVRDDQSLVQVANVAHLPGILRYSMAMPDIHFGYGFPIGGVAAFSVEEGIVSPGGVGYDINCGCRLLATDLRTDDVGGRMKPLIDQLFRDVPSGVGASGAIERLSRKELEKILVRGAAWAVERGYGSKEDLEHTEDGGTLPGADPGAVGERAWVRGQDQVGTLGSGNHFLEIQTVDRVFDAAAAAAYGLREGQITIMVHCGSRGFGYQVCEDSLETMASASHRYGIELPDRQLACAPVTSPEGRQYLAAMACAANYAWANRQMIMHLTEQALLRALRMSPKDLGLRLVYDVAHNIAKLETHEVEGVPVDACVHRKGATRAFGPGRSEIPAAYREIGQPVLIPGDMGTASFICRGADKSMAETFGSTCHGAGRVMSRSQARKRAKGRSIERELESAGVLVRSQGRKTLAEEMPEAYKDVGQVVAVMDGAGISPRVARLRPLGVIKG
ncbi:MAG: RtcB family protein [Actinobacteria bacterium]|jgi:tRNA-splicing ligase RtcB|nr:RtcB family protein [Actinomycetota bacterium]